jgi:ATP-dependent Clp protease adaptor protein ClpS
MKNGTDTEVLEQEEVKTKKENMRSLLLYNDEVNTFDFVIESLVEVCGHDVIQAEQCTFLIHYKGKCEVKLGTYKSLKPLNTELQNRGLSSVIE